MTWCFFDQATNGILLGDFKECIEDGETIFTLEDFNKTSSVNCITDTKSDAAAVTYDVMGRKVTSLEPGSVYIRGGKTFVAR